jgi:hypothetical protein
MGTHIIEIQSAKQGEMGAYTVRELASLPIAAQPAVESGITGELIPVPDGSLREHLRRRLQELGGEDAYVRFVIRYRPDPGEQRPAPPPGWRRQTQLPPIIRNPPSDGTTR